MPKENNTPRRAVICAKDIQGILGRKRTFANKMIRDIKLKLKKERHEFVTVREFSMHTGISEDIVYEWING